MSDTLRAPDAAAAPAMPSRRRLPAPGTTRLPSTPRPTARNSAIRDFASHRLGVFGLATIAMLVIFCFAGPLVYHTDQIHVSLQLTNLPPGPGRPLGTDNNGYDILGRLMAGGQSTLEIGLAVAILATIFGTAWGAISGYTGGLADAVMMRVVDIGLAIPAIFLLIYLSSVFRPTIPLIIVVLSLLSWLGPARLVRGETLSLRTRDFIMAAQAMGSRQTRIVARHLAPNAIGTIIVSATFQVADAIILLATLSFLGFGLPPPTATWGGMLSQGTTYLLDGYWWQVYPAGFVITVTVIAFNLVGDALRDTLDTRLRQR